MTDGTPGRRGGRARRIRPEPSATQRALSMLTRREHSRRELTRKLAARGVEANEAAAVVDKLGKAGWQDDGRYAESMVRSRASAGHGPVRIRAELALHGVDGEQVEAAFAAFEADWVAIARDLVRRRYGEGVADDPARRRKAAELLYRRGFDGDQVRAATRFDPDD